MQRHVQGAQEHTWAALRQQATCIADIYLICNVQVARLEVIGMHCSSCSIAVEKALNGTAGITEATVSLSLNMAEVTYDPVLVTEVRKPGVSTHSSLACACCVGASSQGRPAEASRGDVQSPCKEPTFAAC